MLLSPVENEIGADETGAAGNKKITHSVPHFRQHLLQS
jgi:hypothetical protein